jgi:glycosyltransferase involved in cell wall biosynthesis
MGLAPVQVFWALRFHPVAGPYIDGYLSYGAPGQRERFFGKQAWRVVPTPLAIEAPHADPQEVRLVRAQYPEPFLFGTVAREDKIRSPEFLKAVAAILKAVPAAGYVWTGREHDRRIDEFLAAQGVAERSHFAGWVDAPLYGSAFDAFLETFPLGCGVTGYQALGAGTPLLSYLDENTVFGMQYWNDIKASVAAGAAPDLSGYPILCARSPVEYVQLAQKLAADPGFRAAVGARGKAYFAQEITLGARQADEFFRAVEEVIAAKSARAA